MIFELREHGAMSSFGLSMLLGGSGSADSLNCNLRYASVSAPREKNKVRVCFLGGWGETDLFIEGLQCFERVRQLGIAEFEFRVGFSIEAHSID